MTGRLVTLDLHHAEALENFLVDFDANPSELHAYFCDRNNAEFQHANGTTRVRPAV